MNIYLVRHGKTIFNTQGKVQGWSDTPLTSKGRAGAKTLGEALVNEPIDHIYTSDSGRARETANLIRFHSKNDQQITIHENWALRELYFGGFEGGYNITMLEALKRGLPDQYKDIHMLWDVPLDIVVDTIAAIDSSQQAENWEQYSKRLQEGIHSVVQDAQAQNFNNIYIVSHGLTIRALIRLFNYKGSYDDIENCSVTYVTYENNQFLVKHVNEVKY
ncbi:hypothetical protein DH09_14580 [Bacillaceae bacterium JMAK1]|nr:hypothetical protein DH09_14580 [Bacillaceae bacterium JMAK1]